MFALAWRRRVTSPIRAAHARAGPRLGPRALEIHLGDVSGPSSTRSSRAAPRPTPGSPAPSVAAAMTAATLGASATTAPRSRDRHRGDRRAQRPANAPPAPRPGVRRRLRRGGCSELSAEPLRGRRRGRECRSAAAALRLQHRGEEHLAYGSSSPMVRQFAEFDGIDTRGRRSTSHRAAAPPVPPRPRDRAICTDMAASFRRRGPSRDPRPPSQQAARSNR